jgi:cystathionine beta-lyase/cystathionine gamma-synthase
VPPPERQAIGTSDALIRLSVGLESTEIMIADLDQALA